MTRASLVTWKEMASTGKIPGSEAIAPPADLTPLRSERYWAISDEDILAIGGRAVYLEGVCYPEGFEAAQFVDSETGTRTTMRYLTVSDICTDFDPNFPDALDDPVTYYTRRRPFYIGNGRILDHNGSDISTIRPAENSGLRVTTCIEVRRRSLQIQACEIIDRPPDIAVRIDYHAFEYDRYDRAGASTSLEVSVVRVNENGALIHNVGLVFFDLNQHGQPERIYYEGSLEQVGLSIILGRGETDITTNNKYNARIFDSVLQECLGISGEGLDLKLTTAGLYAATGKPDSNLKTILKTI